MSEADQKPTTTRRTLLCCGAAALAGGSALTLSGCDSSGGSAKSEAKAPPSPVDLGDASAVPVGGGKVYPDQRIVVTQPTAGQYKAFSARCTHAGLPGRPGQEQPDPVPVPRQPLQHRRRHGRRRPGAEPAARLPGLGGRRQAHRDAELS